MPDHKHWSDYQEIYLKGKKIKGGERNDKRISMFNWNEFKGRDVLDIGCNSGMFALEAKRRGARRVVGVEKEDCILNGREIAEKENLDVEFWQLDMESVEFRRYCPKFDIVIFLSMYGYLKKDPTEYLNWLDLKTRRVMYFETNANGKHKQQIEVLKENTSFGEYQYIGPGNQEDSAFHQFWRCPRLKHDLTSSEWEHLPVTFVPIKDIRPKGMISSFDEKDPEIQKLEENIKKHGVKMPLGFAKIPTDGKSDKKFEYVFGEGTHRYYILKELGYKDIPCQITNEEKLLRWHLEDLNRLKTRFEKIKSNREIF